MAKGGRHLAPSKRSSAGSRRSGGIRLVSSRGRGSAERPRRRPVLTMRRDILRAIVFFLLCFLMLSINQRLEISIKYF